MEYKKIIKSRAMRQKILKKLAFIPDKPMLKMQYFIKTGRRLHLKNPSRYTEKLQWYKLYYRNPLMVQCVDKYDVREYVRSKGLEDILLKNYGVYENVDDIDFASLPDSFVIKDTLGGGGNSVILVKDKKELDIEATKKRMQSWLDIKPIRGGGREWPYYSGKKHRIIVEKYINADAFQGGLIDYKFLCFHGKIAIVYVLADRKMGHDAGCGIFDEYFNLLPCKELDERPLERTILKPENYEEMKDVAKRLSCDFPEARIDLYSKEGKIYFGEITFFDSSGYMLFDPDEMDNRLGEHFTLVKWGGDYLRRNNDVAAFEYLEVA